MSVSRTRNNSRPARVSLNEAAKLLRRDRATVHRWVANEGAPTCGSRTVGDRVEWDVDLGALVRWLEDRAARQEGARVEAKLAPELDRLRRALEQAAGEGAGEANTWQEARRRRTQAEARLAELAVAERENLLVDRRENDLMWIEALTIAKTLLLALPGKLAIDLAALARPRECFGLLEREIRATFTSIADAAEGGGFVADETPPDGALERVVAPQLGVEVVARPLTVEEA